MAKDPLVFVIVLNFNGIGYLNNCLLSLELQTYSNFRILVYDNASTDDSLEFIRKNFPSILLIQGKKNFGFAEGNNLATIYALNKGADYVFLLNNDTAVEKDALEKLISTAESDAPIGIVSPAVFDLTETSSIQEMGMAVDKFNVFSKFGFSSRLVGIL